MLPTDRLYENQGPLRSLTIRKVTNTVNEKQEERNSMVTIIIVGLPLLLMMLREIMLISAIHDVIKRSRQEELAIYFPFFHSIQ
jgi:hypothetical protein